MRANRELRIVKRALELALLLSIPYSLLADSAPPLPPEPAPKGHTSITQAENQAQRLRAAKTRQATNSIAASASQTAAPAVDWNAVRSQALADDLFRLSMEQQQRKYWNASPRERATMKPMPPIDRNSPRERLKAKRRE